MKMRIHTSLLCISMLLCLNTSAQTILGAGQSLGINSNGTTFNPAGNLPSALQAATNTRTRNNLQPVISANPQNPNVSQRALLSKQQAKAQAIANNAPAGANSNATKQVVNNVAQQAAAKAAQAAQAVAAPPPANPTPPPPPPLPPQPPPIR